MVLRKPSDYFKNDIVSVNNSIQDLVKKPDLGKFSDVFETFRNNLNKFDIVSEQVKEIQSQIENLLKKEDLDNAMMCQLFIVEDTIKDIQNKVKSINEKNLTEIRSDVSELTVSVNEFLEIEVPKYKKLIVDSELRTNNRYRELEENVNQSIEGIGEFVEGKYQQFTEKIQEINQESFAGILEDFKLLENIIQQFKEQDIPKYRGFIVETERKTEGKINEFQKKLDETVSDILKKVSLIETEKTDLIDNAKRRILEIKNIRDYVIEDLRNSENLKTEISKKVSGLEVEIVRNESHIKIQNKTLEKIQEDVKNAIQRLNLEELEEKNYELSKKVNYLEEIFEKFSENEILTENIIVEPPSTDNKDSLTPLDKNFVTLEQLQEHYRLFINRIQQQLATIGGGGETQLKYLDDVVGIATNASAYDGKFLKYNHSIKKFEFETVIGGGESYWVSTNIGIHTTSNVGIATTNIISQLSVGSFYGIDTTITGITTTTATTIDSFSAAIFRSARLQVQITQGYDYQAVDLLVIHDGSSVNIIEYGSIATNDYLGSFNGIVIGENVIISVTMNSEIEATAKVVSNRITL